MNVLLQLRASLPVPPTASRAFFLMPDAAGLLLFLTGRRRFSGGT
jgi:hypothetical protein